MNSNMTHNAAHDEEMSMDEILASIRRYVTGAESSSTPEKSFEAPPTFNDPSAVHTAPNTQASYPYSAAYTPPSKVVTLTVDDMVASKPFHTPASSEKPSTPDSSEDLISNTARSSAQKAFQKIEQIKEMSSNQKQTSQKGIDDFVGELLKPLMKSWLDKNLPELVERIVEREIQKALNTGEGS